MTPPAAIHPTAIVDPQVEIGAGTIIGPYSVVIGPCRIGERCWIGPHCVIGTTGEDIDHMVVPEVPDEPLDPAELEARLWFCGMGVGIDLSGRPAEQVETRLGVSIKDRAKNTVLWEGRAGFSVSAKSPQAQTQLGAAKMAEALFKGTARALRAAVAIDPRQTGVPSSKGTLV